MREDRAAAVAAVADALVAAMGERRARAVLAELGHRAALAELDRAKRVHYVRGLLAAGMSRVEVRDRLMAEGDSRSTAYRLIDSALSQGPRDSGTAARHDARIVIVPADPCLPSPTPWPPS